MARTAKQLASAAANAARATQLFGAPDSLFTGRARVTAKALDKGLCEMVARVYANVPNVAPMLPGAARQIALTYIGDTAQCRYEWRIQRNKFCASGVINLPAIGEHNHVIARSIADQYTAYTLHELSHMLLTPLNAFQRAIPDLAYKHHCAQSFAQGIVNALEDVAIERTMIGAGYAPGAATMLRGLCAKSVANVPRAAYGTLKAFTVTLAFGLRGYAPGAQAMVDALPADLRKVYDMAAAGMAALPLRSVGDVAGMDGVRDVADAVLGALRTLADAQKAKQPAPQPGEGAPDEPQPGEGEPDEPQPGEENLAQGMEQTPISTDMAPDMAGDPADGASGIANANVRIVPLPRGTRSAELAMQSTGTRVLSKAPKVAQALRQILDASAYDTKEGGRRSGALRTSALARVATGSETVFERRSYLDGTDAAVSLLIDQSSSMYCGAPYSRIEHARDLAAALARILAQSAGTTFECLGFTTGHGAPGGNATFDWQRDIASNLGSQEDQSLLSALRGNCTINVFKTFKEAPALAYGRLKDARGSGGTPDAHAVITACDRLLKQPAGRRVFIMLADGEGSPAKVLSHILQRYERQGVVCIGIGVGGCEMNAAFTHRVSVEDSANVGASGLAALLVAIARDHTYKGGGDD